MSECKKVNKKKGSRIANKKRSEEARNSLKLSSFRSCAYSDAYFAPKLWTVACAFL